MGKFSCDSSIGRSSGPDHAIALCLNSPPASRFFWVAVVAAGVIATQATLPAFAQYQAFTPARVTQKGKTARSIPGAGRVVVKVQVNADGTHKVLEVMQSSNSADDAAAIDIAQNSSYSAGRSGTTPITTLYDLTLSFDNKTVVFINKLAGGSTNGESAGANVPAKAEAIQFDCNGYDFTYAPQIDVLVDNAYRYKPIVSQTELNWHYTVSQDDNGDYHQEVDYTLNRATLSLTTRWSYPDWPAYATARWPNLTNLPSSMPGGSTTSQCNKVKNQI